MNFQSTVRDDIATGVVGEIAFDGPTRARPYILDSGGATPNTVGNAFTVVTGTDDKAGAGAIGAGAFAGILINPKSYALVGTPTNTLAPSLDLPDETPAELLTMGTVFVDVTAGTFPAENWRRCLLCRRNRGHWCRCCRSRSDTD